MPRPKAFDPADKLDEAMQLFWQGGFESTSIPKLEKALKINRFSIYDTYGDKRRLFISVLSRYAQILSDELVRPLARGERGLADLEAFFESFWHKFSAQQGSGCLLCNTATETGRKDTEIARLIGEYFESLGEAMLQSLIRARNLRELSGSDTELRAHVRLLKNAIMGILVELRLAKEASSVHPAFLATTAYVHRLGQF